METRPKTFHYKEGDTGDVATDLQALLTAAFARAPKIKHRQQPLDTEGTQIRFLSLNRVHKKVLCGVVVIYTKGQHQAVVPVDEDAKEVPLEQIAPPDNTEGKRTEFVEGTMFFGVFVNHVILVQSANFRAKQLEDYFNWLLRRGLSADVQPPLISIIDKPPLNLRQKAITGVKTITLKAPIEFKTQTEKTKGKEIVLKPEGLGFRLFESAMDSVREGFSDAFRFNEALESGDIEVRLQLFYRKRTKKGTAPIMLDDIAAALSHTDVEYEMDIPGYGKVGSDVLKIRQDHEVDAPGGLPSASSVFKIIPVWMETLISGGMV